MRSLRNSAHIEIEKQKGSRFIAFALPLENSICVSALLEQVQELHPKARHLCYAWRTQDGQSGISDSGEPRGSAGTPILQPLLGRDIVNILVVVVRYFGGTKLGIGGLVRAYGAASQAVLEECSFQEVIPTTTIVFSYGYEHESSLRRILALYPSAVAEFEYSEHIQVVITIEESQEADFRRALDDATSGMVLWGVSEEE